MAHPASTATRAGIAAILMAMVACIAHPAIALTAAAPSWAHSRVPPLVDEQAFGLAGAQAASEDLPVATLRTAAGRLTLAIAGAHFVITDADGHRLPQEALIGAVLAVADDAGAQADVRIESVTPDPHDPSGEVLLYGFALRTSDGAWRNFCAPDPDGLALGFPVSGMWTQHGEHERASGAFSLTCTSGVIGKCVRMGYAYWKTRADGAPMWELHQACTRMLRADYCGDGRSHTRDGTLINVYDRFGIQRPDPEPARFEATWAADGAVCVERTRIPEIATLREIVASCPDRLAARNGEACDGAERLGDGRAMLANRS